jgi:hypothetical protein
MMAVRAERYQFHDPSSGVDPCDWTGVSNYKWENRASHDSTQRDAPTDPIDQPARPYRYSLALLCRNSTSLRGTRHYRQSR